MDRRGEADGRPCFYEVLGLPRTCSAEDIKRAYRLLAVQHHPDKNPGNEAASAQLFTMIAEAYEVLSDDTKRRMYDSRGRAGVDEHERGAHPPASASAARPPSTAHGFEADYGFRRAQNIFEAVFGRGSPFATMHQEMMRGIPGFGVFGNGEEEAEGDFFGGPGFGVTSSFFGGGGGGVFGQSSRSLFDNPAAFFSGGGGGFDNSISAATAAAAASSFASSSHAAFRGGGGGGGTSCYEHSFVRFGLDGTRRLVRQTTVVHADGRREEHVVEELLGPQQGGWLQGSP